LEPSGAFTALLLPVLQQPQPGPCRRPPSAGVRGAWALRSLLACSAAFVTAEPGLAQRGD